MEPGDIIAIIIIALAIGGALFYIIKAKKSGKKCIGCPDGCCTCKTKEKSDRKDADEPLKENSDADADGEKTKVYSCGYGGCGSCGSCGGCGGCGG